MPVYSWSWKCLIVTGKEEIPCALLPYSPSTRLSVKPTSVVSGSPDELLEANIENRVVLIKYPEKIEELRFVIYLLGRKNPAAVVLVTPEEGLLKVDVVLGTPGYTYLPSLPPNIPVLCVDPKAEKVLTTNDVDIEAESRVTKSSAQVVLAGLNGSGELEVHLTSHHDTIIGDFKTTSASMLPALAEYLRKQELPLNLTMISYTAREVGDLDFTEYHYTWGERYLLRILDSKGVLDNVAYSMSIGPLNPKGELTAIAHPALSRYIEGVSDRVKHDHFLLESHPYMELGIPALTLTTREALLRRNSTYHYVVYGLEEMLNKVLNVVSALLKSAKPSEEWVKHMREYTINAISDQRLEIRVEVTRLLDIVQLHDLVKGIKATTSVAYSLVELACTRPLKVHVEASPLASISHSVLSALRETAISCRDEVLIGNNQGYRFLKLASGFEDLFLDLYIEYLVKSLKTFINNEIGKFICKSQLMRCVGSGEKGYWNRQV